MTQSPRSNDKTTKQPPKETSAAILLIMTTLDTTWRAFVPTIGGTFLGIGLDHLFHTAPWWTVVTVALGFAGSIILIIMQIRDVRKK